MPMISDKDLEIFDSYRLKYAGGENYSVCGRFAPGREILTEWEKAKSKWLFKIFGDKFILEKEVEFEESTYELTNKMHKVYCLHREFEVWYRAALGKIGEYWNVAMWPFYELVSPSILATNRVPEHWSTSKIEINGSTISLFPNAKVIKIIGKIVKAINDPKGLELFENFRLAHSQALNTSKSHGTLCLSIHPMDYITMSDNNSGWSSCMSWFEDGSYRMGTVEMMNSRDVIVAYLRNEGQIRWDGSHSWNNKKWRSLFVINPQTILSVKGYPYQHDPLMQQVMEWLRELVKPVLGEYTKLESFRLDSDDEFTLGGKHFRRTYIETRGKMYNDFGTTTHWGCINPDADFTEVFEVEYGGYEQCMCCGASGDGDFTGEENYVVCYDCCDTYDNCNYCDCCGERVYDDDVYWIDDRPYCYSCAMDIGFEDKLTGQMEHLDNLVEIYLATTPDDPSDSDLCIETRKYYATSLSRPKAWGSYDNHWQGAERPKPKYHEESHRYYWNIADLHDIVLGHDFGLRGEKLEQLRKNCI